MLSKSSESNIFLKRMTSSLLKMRGVFDFKSFKSVGNNSHFLELTAGSRDIFSKSVKKISLQYFINNSKSTLLKENPDEEATNILFRISPNDDTSTQVRFVKDSKDDKQTNIEIWINSTHFKTINLGELSIKNIYFDDVFGKPQFSPDGHKVVFIAEIDSKKALKHYFNLPEDEKFDEEFEKTIHKFDYKQDFGELMTSKTEPILFVLDLTKQKVSQVKIKIDNFYPSNPIFNKDSKGLIFAAFDCPWIKLGMVYCLKRKSDIYFLEDPVLEELPSKPKDKKPTQENENVNEQTPVEITHSDLSNLIKISKEDYTNIVPKFSEDFKYLSYFSNEQATPHMNGLRLNVVNWESKDSKVIIEKIQDENQWFNSIYSYDDSIAKSGWISSDFYLFSSDSNGRNKTYLFHLDSNTLLDFGIHFENITNVEIIKIIEKKFVLLNLSSSNRLPEVFLLELDVTKIRDLINKSKPTIKLENNIFFFEHAFVDEKSITQVTSNFNFFEKFNETNHVPDAEKENIKYLKEVYDSIVVEDLFINGIHGYSLYSTKAKNVLINENDKRPLLYFIHGGPNSNTPKSFMISMLGFLSLNYVIVVVNFKGSTGYGQKYLSELSGNIGDLDITNCGEFLIDSLEKYKEIVDPSRVFAFGGSHGGYLSAWLVCHDKYSKLIKTAVVRNPVIDLMSMMGTTDIPDWVFEQSINTELEYPPKLEHYKKFFEKSPIFKVDNVSASVLIMLGKVDQRVNYFQGHFFYNSLRKRNKKTRLIMYPEDSHPLNSPETEIDGMLNYFNWFQQNISN